MKIQLYNDDCLNAMKNIPDKSVDLVLCDLPYGTTAQTWDIVIPMDKLWEEYKRIITDTGVIALFGDASIFMAKLISSNSNACINLSIPIATPTPGVTGPPKLETKLSYLPPPHKTFWLPNPLISASISKTVLV